MLTFKVRIKTGCVLDTHQHFCGLIAVDNGVLKEYCPIHKQILSTANARVRVIEYTFNGEVTNHWDTDYKISEDVANNVILLTSSELGTIDNIIDRDVVRFRNMVMEDTFINHATGNANNPHFVHDLLNAYSTEYRDTHVASGRLLDLLSKDSDGCDSLVDYKKNMRAILLLARELGIVDPTTNTIIRLKDTKRVIKIATWGISTSSKFRLRDNSYIETKNNISVKLLVSLLSKGNFDIKIVDKKGVEKCV